MRGIQVGDDFQLMIGIFILFAFGGDLA